MKTALTIPPNEHNYNYSLGIKTEEIGCTLVPRVPGGFCPIPEYEESMDTFITLEDDDVMPGSQSTQITFYYSTANKNRFDVVVATNYITPVELKARVADPSLVTEPTIVGITMWRQEYVSVMTRRSARLLWEILMQGNYKKIREGCKV